MAAATARTNASTLSKSTKATPAAKSRKPAPSILDGLPPLTRLLIPRVSAMGDGTFRPEVVIGNDGLGDIHFGTPVGSIEEARRLALEACQRGVLAAAEALT